MNTRVLKKGDTVKLSQPLTYSIAREWQSMSSLIVKRKIKYGVIDKIFSSIENAVRVMYIIKGQRFHTYIHDKDLQVIDEIPEIKKVPVTFDENNLDI